MRCGNQRGPAPSLGRPHTHCATTFLSCPCLDAVSSTVSREMFLSLTSEPWSSNEYIFTLPSQLRNSWGPTLCTDSSRCCIRRAMQRHRSFSLTSRMMLKRGLELVLGVVMILYSPMLTFKWVSYLLCTGRRICLFNGTTSRCHVPYRTR